MSVGLKLDATCGLWKKAFISFYIVMCYYFFTFTDDYSFLDRVPDQSGCG